MPFNDFWHTSSHFLDFHSARSRSRSFKVAQGRSRLFSNELGQSAPPNKTISTNSQLTAQRPVLVYIITYDHMIRCDHVRSNVITCFHIWSHMIAHHMIIHYHLQSYLIIFVYTLLHMVTSDPIS